MPLSCRLSRCVWAALLAALACSVTAANADERLRPYILVDAEAGTLAAAESRTRAQLEGSAFTVVGEYSPYDGAKVIALSHPELLAAAAGTEYGAYAAVLRMALTENAGVVERSYVNPVYMGLAYQVGSLDSVAAALQALFGEGESFGSAKGLTEKKLSRYRYMMMMPTLRDHDRLGSFDSHAAALETIRRHLAANDHSLRGVFEVAVPGTEEVLFGVGIGAGDGADATVMATTDTGTPRHTAHLPYAVLVSGSDAYALAGKFRIALAFPDLGMGTFMKISAAPAAIRDALATLTETSQGP
jgi:hypothetical protein